MFDDFNFWQSFFGVELNTDDRFIKQLNRLFPVLQSEIWGVKQPVWIDTNDLWKVFIEIPELRAVIDKRASMMSSNKPLLVDKEGKEVTNHWFNDVLNKPNGTQSWSDFVYSISVQDAIYSNTFIYAPKRSFNIVNLMIPLPSNKIQINLSGRKLKQMEKEGLIEKYVFKYDNNSTEEISVEDMVYLMTNDGMNIVKPVSRLESLKFVLSNLKAQYKKRNVLLENIGAIGILTAQNNDIGGAIPMTPEDKKQIQKDWFRRSKDELIITESDVKWQPMSYPTKDLMLFEELNADKIALIDAFGLSMNLFSSEKGTTFTNVRDSIRMTYQDTIIPETQQMYDSLVNQLGLDKEGLRLIALFDHLPVLAEDEFKLSRSMKARAEALEKIVAMGVTLTEEEIRSITGV
jgi:HK97 family phage portal protein